MKYMFLAILVLIIGCSSENKPRPKVFVKYEGELTPHQTKLYNRIKANKTTAAYVLIKFDLTKLSGPFDMPFPGGEFTVKEWEWVDSSQYIKIERTEENRTKAISWKISDIETGLMTIGQKDTYIIGNFWHDNKGYTIQGLNDNLIMVVEINYSGFPPDDCGKIPSKK
jgi:hypothetical protein